MEHRNDVERMSEYFILRARNLFDAKKEDTITIFKCLYLSYHYGNKFVASLWSGLNINEYTRLFNDVSVCNDFSELDYHIRDVISITSEAVAGFYVNRIEEELSSTDLNTVHIYKLADSVWPFADVHSASRLDNIFLMLVENILQSEVYDKHVRYDDFSTLLVNYGSIKARGKLCLLYYTYYEDVRKADLVLRIILEKIHTEYSNKSVDDKLGEFYHIVGCGLLERSQTKTKGSRGYKYILKAATAYNHQDSKCLIESWN
jgi:hypothetical protein